MGGSEKKQINAILNSKLKFELVEVGVELGNFLFRVYFYLSKDNYVG